MDNNSHEQVEGEQLDRLELLLDVWEEQISKGFKPDPAMVCQDAPELLPSFLKILSDLNQTEWIERQVSKDGYIKPTLKSGDEIIPKHRLLEPLGSGGFGQVWKASGPGGVQVALKFLWLGEQRTRLEWKALSQLKALRHPHLLGLFGYWISQGWLVIGTELALGSLADHSSMINPGKTGNQCHVKTTVLGHLRDAADGLDYLHTLESPLVHGDVKPGNLLLVGGRCKVGDFGLIRKWNRSDEPQADGLTVRYAAPEALLGEPVPESDQFSLALTYCHLTGIEPFHGDGIDIVHAHLKGSPDLACLKESERYVLEKALDKEPTKRFPSCVAFIAELTKAVVQDRQKPTRPLHFWALSGVILLALATLPFANHLRQKDPPADSQTKQQLSVPVVLPNSPVFKGTYITSMASDKLGNLMCLDILGQPAFFSIPMNDWVAEQPGSAGGLVQLTPHPNGKTIFSNRGREPFDVEEWDAATRTVVRRFLGNKGFIRSVAVSDDGKKLATTNYDGKVMVFDLEGERVPWTLGKKNYHFHSIRFSRDGASIIYSTEHGLLFYSRVGTEFGVPILPRQDFQYWCLELIPDSEAFVLGSTNGDLIKIDPAKILQPETWQNFGQSLTAFAVKPNSGLLAVGTGDIHGLGPEPRWRKPDSYPLHLVDLKTGNTIGTFHHHTSPIQSLAWSTDGKFLFSSAKDGSLVRWLLE